MINPFDLWTIAHGSVGYLLGEAKLKRWVFYLMPVGWEIVQLYYHYEPEGLRPEDVWLNSGVDILACIGLYEIALRYPLKPVEPRLRLIIENKSKKVHLRWLFRGTGSRENGWQPGKRKSRKATAL